MPRSPTPVRRCGPLPVTRRGRRRCWSRSTNGTGLGDNVNELDQMFVLPDSAGLHLGITGNLGTYGTALALFFDPAPGGQNTLETAPFPQPPDGLPALH